MSRWFQAVGCLHIRFPSPDTRKPTSAVRNYQTRPRQSRRRTLDEDEDEDEARCEDPLGKANR